MSRRAGTNGSVVPDLNRAARRLRAGRPGDALPPLEAAARRWHETATLFARSAAARADPREAARQLLVWEADLDRQGRAAPADERQRWEACRQVVLAAVGSDDPTAARDLATLVREYPAPGVVCSRVADGLRRAVARLDAADSGTGDKLADRLETLPPAADSAAARLAAAAARRLTTAVVRGRTADVAAGLTEVRWRVGLLADRLAGGDDPLADPSPDRLAALAARVGLPQVVGRSPNDLRAAVRVRLAGEDSEPERVAHIARWWAGQREPTADQRRRLVALLESVPGGDRPAAVTDGDHAARHGTRAAVGDALVRLREDYAGRAAEFRPLAGVGPPARTAADRLIDLDADEHLPSHRSADTAAGLAREVEAVSRDAAAFAAAEELRTLAVARAEFAPAVGRLTQQLDRSHPPVGATAAEAGHLLKSNLAAVEVWARAASTLRQVACTVPAGELGDGRAVAVGESLGGVEDELARAGEACDVTGLLRRASARVEAVCR